MSSITKNNRGFTIIEIMIAMVIFLIILAIASGGMINILRYGINTLRSETTNIEGIVGIEVVRHDLQQAGYGLFTNETETPTYAEASSQTAITGIAYNFMNDTGVGVAPRLVVASNDTNGISASTDFSCLKPDYLAIKATSLGRSIASQKWTTIDENGAMRVWGRDDFVENDRVVVMEERFDTELNMLSRTLKTQSATQFSPSFPASGALSEEYIPSAGRLFFLFGLEDAGTIASGVQPRAPYNRADYFVRRDANTPSTCSPATGVLYRATMNQTDGTFRETPVLDCVADMQVVYGINTTTNPETDSSVQTFVHADFTTLYKKYAEAENNVLTSSQITSIATNSLELRKRLKLIIVYLMVQDGQKDSKFMNDNPPSTDLTRHFLIGGSDFPNSFNKFINLYNGYTVLPNSTTKSPNTDKFRNYRWKLHRIVVKPRNM